MVEVNWTHDAVADIDGIATYISRDSPKSAALLVERFFACADLLAKNPKRGKPVREAGTDTIRELIVSSYRVIYSLVDEGRIDVLTIHHQRRQLPRSLITQRIRRR